MVEQDEPGANLPQVPSQPGNARPNDALPGPHGAPAPHTDGPAQAPQSCKAANAKRPRGTPKHDPTEAPDSQPSPSALAASEEQGRDSKRRRVGTNGSSKDATAAQQQQTQLAPSAGRAAAGELRSSPSPMKAAAETATLAEAAAALLAPTSTAGAAADENKAAIIAADACREAADQVEWVPLLKGLGDPGSSCPEAGPWRLQLPTTASADLWLQYRDDPDIFNVGLVGDTSATDAKPVPVAAVDMLVASEWFRGLIGHRKQLAGSLRASSLHALPLPLRVGRDALETLVRGLYEGQLHLGPGNMEAVLRAADAMQMPAVVAAVQEYITAFVKTSEGDGADFCLSAFNLAQALGMDVWSKRIVVLVVGPAIHSCRQRDAMRAMLWSFHSAAQQASLLRAGCWQRCGDHCSEMLVLQFIFWLHQRPNPHGANEQLLLRRLQRAKLQLQRDMGDSDEEDDEDDNEGLMDPPAAADLLEHVEWKTLHRAELEALAHQTSAMPADDALSRRLHRKLLPLLADPGRPKAPPGGHYMVMALDVTDLEAVDNDNPNAVIKSETFKVEGHDVYLRCWHKKDVGWGLYTAPGDKDDRLSAFADSAAHFFLQHEYSTGRLIVLRQPYSLATTAAGANLGMAGQVTKFLAQYGESGAVHQSSDGKRTIHVGVMVRALDSEERAKQEKLHKEQQQQQRVAAAAEALL